MLYFLWVMLKKCNWDLYKELLHAKWWSIQCIWSLLSLGSSMQLHGIIKAAFSNFDISGAVSAHSAKIHSALEITNIQQIYLHIVLQKLLSAASAIRTQTQYISIHFFQWIDLTTCQQTRKVTRILIWIQINSAPVLICQYELSPFIVVRYFVLRFNSSQAD